MTDIATLTTKVLNLLYGLERVEHPAEDTLNGAVLVGAATLTPTTTAMWKADDYAEFPVNDEVVRFAADSAGATAVRRAQLGTTAAAQSDGAVMVKNPPFFRHFVKDQIIAVVRTELYPHVWSWHQDSLTPSDTDFMYDLDDQIEEVVLVFQENIRADERFRALPPGWWDVERQIDSTVATNLNLLVINRVHDYDETVYYIAKRRPDPSTAGLTALSDAIAEMVPWAAAAKCVAMRHPQSLNAGIRNAEDKNNFRQSYQLLMAEFLRMRDQYRRQLLTEVRADMRWRPPSRSYGRSW